MGLAAFELMIISELDAIATGLRYGITIDPSDLTHYKLVQVILMHESNSPELKRIIELNAKADKVEKLPLAEKSA